MFGPYASFIVMLFLCTGAVLVVGHMSARERRLRGAPSPFTPKAVKARAGPRRA